jgi:hypothetical protein
MNRWTPPPDDERHPGPPHHHRHRPPHVMLADGIAHCSEQLEELRRDFAELKKMIENH